MHPDYGGTLLDLGIDSCRPLPQYAGMVWYTVTDGPNGPRMPEDVMRVHSIRAAVMGLSSTFEALFMAYLNLLHNGKPVYYVPREYGVLQARCRLAQKANSRMTA